MRSNAPSKKLRPHTEKPAMKTRLLDRLMSSPRWHLVLLPLVVTVAHADPLLTHPLNIAPCVAGLGHDYTVGPTQPYTELDQVPWESLTAGDTVRIFARDTPYRGKFMLSTSGTVHAPIRVCGVRGSDGKRPSVSAVNAVTRRHQWYGDPLHESRSIIVIKRKSNSDWTSYPQYIQIDGLNMGGATPKYSFIDTNGVTQKYTDFGACIWVDRGHHITIADNLIHDCTNGIFTKSTDDGDFAVTRDIRIAGNTIYRNGLSGRETLHNSYVQSIGVVYEYNRYGPLVAGAGGNLIKDRSVGTVIRYNHLSGGAHAIDLVEAEDYAVTAMADPAYRTSYVYGNRIVKDGGTGSLIHYGGDHSGSEPNASWGEPIYRKGTLYFYGNSVNITGSSGALFQLSTTEEHAEIWNNAFYFEPTVTYPQLRQRQDVNTTYWTNGGVLNLGKNWMNANWTDAGPWHVVGGQVFGQANMITGTRAPFAAVTLLPLVDSPLLDVAQADLSAVASYPAQYQLNTKYVPMIRQTKGAGRDLGALER
jgi:hypothetical protein